MDLPFSTIHFRLGEPGVVGNGVNDLIQADGDQASFVGVLEITD